jgi:hydrogenase-4 component E
MTGLSFDVSHLLAGGLVLLSFMLLYQTRLYSLIQVYSAQAFVLSLSVA